MFRGGYSSITVLFLIIIGLPFGATAIKWFLWPFL